MLDKSVNHIDIYMKRPPLDPPEPPLLKSGFSIVNYRDGDEYSWAEIEKSVLEFENETDALEWFRKFYFPYREMLYSRCHFARTPEGKLAGTATAWKEVHNGVLFPVIYWVAVKPEYQGLGLGKALIAASVRTLCSVYGKCEIWLHTQTESHRAVRIYEKNGFVMQPFDMKGDEVLYLDKAREIIDGIYRT